MGRTSGRGKSLFQLSLTGLLYDPDLNATRSSSFPLCSLRIGLDGGAVKFDKMPLRNIDFSKKQQYVKNSVDPERVTEFYSYMSNSTHSPVAIKKQKTYAKNSKLPRYLQVCIQMYNPT
ncbi:MAG: hypothetical protein P4M11_13900 [Candidatus Pacebacteria bacterium]|nr:hypothetical protein [Candidatus Paceibacterota bacterium]